VTRATVGSCVGLPVRSRIADKAWARGMRRERRETWARARAWQRGAWAQCSGFVPKRPKRFMRIKSRLSRSACACLCESTRLVGPWATCCEGRLDDHHAVRSVPCEAAPDYQSRERDVRTILREARANASAGQFMRINRGPRERRLSHVSQKPQGRKLTAACRKAQASGSRQRTTKKHRLLYRTNGQSIAARQPCAH